MVGVDRVAPDPGQRRTGGHFVRADLRALPFPRGSFDAVTSFQVIEHLEDPAPYLESIAGLLGAEGVVLLTTPNVRMSDGVNPYHVHEFEAEELATLLREHFHDVEVRGIGIMPMKHTDEAPAAETSETPPMASVGATHEV